ncbi:hypothetical protein ACIBHX_47930 [Nonomuraea sp. NPDC050536]|uniref:hypothetical protein n=1 Tax=Nonomuraea sp. NPDC050536 TaxID=3364366 RepID=UPI0037C62C43
MTDLPSWPADMVAVLVTEDLRAVPVSGAVRAGDRTILLSVRRGLLRGTVKVMVVFEGFVASGTARIAADPMARAPGFAAVDVDVSEVHGYQGDQEALGERVRALEQLAFIRLSCRAAYPAMGLDRSSSATTS